MDYEGLFDLDTATADALRAKYGGGGDAVGSMAPPATQGGMLPPGIDPSWLQAPAPRPTVQGVSHSAPAPAAAPPLSAPQQAGGLFNYAATLKPDAQPTASAAPAPAPQAPPTMGGGGPVTIPGHWSDDKSEQTVTRTGDPAALEAIAAKNDSAQGYGQSAADSAYQAQALGIGLDQRQAEMQQQEARTYEAMAARNAVERQQYVQQSRVRLQEMSDNLAKDPSKEYWAKKSDGDKALSFFSVLLGGIGAGITGGPNLAAQKIENEINRGVAAQEKAYGRQQNIYQEMLAEFGDRATAIQAMKVASYDKVAQQLAPLRASAKSMDAKARYEQGMAALMEKRAKEDAELQKLLGAKYEEKSSQKYKDAQVIGGAVTKPLDNTATLSDGTSVQFQNSEQGNKAVEKFQAHAKVQALYNTAKQLRAKTAEAAPGSAEHEAAHRQLEKIASDIIYEESMARGQGVVKEDEMRRGLETSPILAGVGSRGLLGYTSKINPWTSRDFAAGNKGIDAALQQSETEQRALVKASGGRIINRGYARDVAGKITPTGEYTGQDLKPDQQLAPEGFRPLDSRKDIAKAARRLADVTPMAPMRKK
jgi:hypothetical protein